MITNKVSTRAERMRENAWRHRGINLAIGEYEVMLAEQGGRCAICYSDNPGDRRGTRFAVDHDHATGEIRALLCRRCNSGLGLFHEDPNRLRAAAAYLEEWTDACH